MTHQLRLLLVSCVVLGNLPRFLYAEESQYEALLAKAGQCCADGSYAKARDVHV